MLSHALALTKRLVGSRARLVALVAAAAVVTSACTGEQNPSLVSPSASAVTAAGANEEVLPLLAVKKTAVTTFNRDFDWTIVKTATPDVLTLSEGQTGNIDYDIVVTKSSAQDEGWSVSGTISILNNSGVAATNVVVTDTITGFGGTVTVTCPVANLPVGFSTQCTYGPIALPDGTARTNTASATADGFGVATDTAPVTFGTPANITDNCVTIDDTYAGGPQSVNICASQTFEYTRQVAADDLECGDTVITNTASLATDDGQTEESTANVKVFKDCETTGGCTLTQGYWKTHSIFGPAPYDNTWASGLDPAGNAFSENTAFYASGKTYYQVLWTPPAGGNAYYQLAHQYIATLLNIAAGATPPAGVNLSSIHTWFVGRSPAAPTGAARTQALAWAAQLDAYNNGLSNVNHCSE